MRLQRVSALHALTPVPSPKFGREVLSLSEAGVRALAYCALLLCMLTACARTLPLPTAQPVRTEAFMQPGVSLELARHRAATISGVEYDLALDVTAPDTAPGTLTLRFQRSANAGDLVVDFRGPVLDSVSANGTPVTDYSWEQGHIVIPARHLEPVPTRWVSVSPPPSLPQGRASSATTIPPTARATFTRCSFPRTPINSSPASISRT